MACHGANGEGTVLAPPLAKSNWVNGPVENLIRIQLRGLQGPITVSGNTGSESATRSVTHSVTPSHSQSVTESGETPSTRSITITRRLHHFQ